MDKEKYFIENVGCDDTTRLVIDLTENERDIFIKICKELNKNSSYGCQPVIDLYKYNECDVEIDEEDNFTMINTYSAKNLLGRS